jgi:general secretion pathway protein A
MYLNYYEFRKPPFHVTPDPEFFFLSPGHREALASLIYGVENRKGLISMTGEVGTGKTTVIHTFLQVVKSSSLTPVVLINPQLTFRKLVRILIGRLGGAADAAEIDELLDRLNQLLKAAHAAKRTVVLILDEAQNTPLETLGQLHLLSNLEDEKEKRLQILLIGQPELEIKLQSPELPQLRQRIAVRARIPLLTGLESREYIRHRLNTAAGHPVMPFVPAALRKIIAAAKGSPRALNILCDNALIAGFGSQRKRIPARVVREVLRDFRRTRVSPVAPFSLAFGLGSAALVAAVLIPLLFQGPGPSASPTAETAPLASAAGMPPLESVRRPGLPGMDGSPGAETGADPGFENGPGTPAERLAENREESASQDSPGAGTTVAAATAPELRERRAPAAHSGGGEGEPFGSFPVVRVVRPGDCLSKMCAEIYGKAYGNHPSVLKRLQAANANLADVNRLSIGDRIVFPELHIGENGHDPNL